MDCRATDFSNSFLTWKLPGGGYGRFIIESVLKVKPGGSGDVKVLVLCAGVTACNVYSEGVLIKAPEYFFQAFFTEKDHKILRIYQGARDVSDSAGPNSAVFEDVKIALGETAYDRLQIPDGVGGAVLANRSLVGVIHGGGEGFQFDMEFPVKHINSNPEHRVFQVESGPVFAPILGAFKMEALNVAYVAFNRADKVEFAVLTDEPGGRVFRRKDFPGKFEIELYAGR